TRLDGSGEVAERLGLSRAHATLSQRLDASLGDGPGRGERVEAAAALLKVLTEAFDQPPHDGHARVQAHLLEGHYIRERFEQLGEPRRPHATQRERRGAKPALGLRQTSQGIRVHVQTEHLSYGPSKGGARGGGRIAPSNGEPNIGVVDGSAVLHLDQRET